MASKWSRGNRGISLFGQEVQISAADLVPPRPLTKPIDLDGDFRFLVLDVNGRDTDYTHWISPDTTDKTILELYSFLYMVNRIFFYAGQKCCVFLQQKEQLVPGNLLVRKEVVTGHILYFGFDRQVLDEILPTCITLALMINAKHFDARCLFVSPLSLDALKAEAWGYDAVKGVANSVPGSGKKRADVAGVFGSSKTLCELARCLLTYHRVSLVEEVAYEETKETDDRCRYNQLRRTMIHMLCTEDETVFATGLRTLLSAPFLFEKSFRMARPYREMREFITINGRGLGLDDRQIQYATTGEPKTFIERVKEVTDRPAASVESPMILDCLRNAVRRYHWSNMFVSFGYGGRLDLTSGLAWQVPDGHLQHPFNTPLYTMVFPKEQVDRGMQMLREVIDQRSIDQMSEMERQLEAYSLIMGQERSSDTTDVRRAATCRQGTVDDETRKYPLFTYMRNVLEKFAEVIQPGSKVRELYRSQFAELTGKLLEDAVRSPNHPTSNTLESLVSLYPTLVDRRRNFHGLHLNSLKNDRTGKFVLAVHDPFDDTVDKSDGLLLHDFLTYTVACNVQLQVETVELRLAATSGVVIHTRNIWVGWQGPPGNGKTTGAKTVLHGISQTDGICIPSMVRDIDSMTTASLKSSNDDPLVHCNGVAFVNELNDGGNDKSGTLKDDSSEKSTLMKNFFDFGLSSVYRARVNENLNEVRQNVQYVIFDCVFIALANHLSLCPSLSDRMLIHTINKTTTSGDRMTLEDIFQRMDRLKVGHYEMFKLLVISLVSMFEFVGCSLEDDDYLSDMERLAFYVIDQELRAMQLDVNFLGRGRLLDNIRSLVRMLAMHRAVLTVLGCVDTFRLQWEEHDDSRETLDAYNQRIMQRVVDDLQHMTLHELVRRVQEVYCPSPADYISVVTMECLDQNSYLPVYRAIVRAVVDPSQLETTGDGRKVFMVPDMTFQKLCDLLNEQRIPFENKDIRTILDATMTSVLREGIPVFAIVNRAAGRQSGNGPSLFQMTFDARMAAEVVIDSDMMHLVSQLTQDIQDRITQVVNELPPFATRDQRFDGKSIFVDPRQYGSDANRFFGFLSQLRPNRWTSRYDMEVVDGYVPDSRVVKVSSDFNHARLKLMRRWMLESAEDPRNVISDKGYIRVEKMNQCSELVGTILDLRVCDTFGHSRPDGNSSRKLLPFFTTGKTVYVHQALPMLRLGIGEVLAGRLRKACASPEFPIEYCTFEKERNLGLLEDLNAARPPHVDVEYTTMSDAFLCEQDIDDRGSGAWLHVSILSKLEEAITTTSNSSPEIPRQFVSKCMRKDLTERKTVLFFNKRGKGPAFDLLKVEEIESAHGGELPRLEVPKVKNKDFMPASLAMLEEGHTNTLGAKHDRATTFSPRHETRYLTRKYLASTGRLREIEERCTSVHGNDYDAREKAIHAQMEALTDEWMERVKNRYRPLKLGPGFSTVEDFIIQNGGNVD